MARSRAHSGRARRRPVVHSQRRCSLRPVRPLPLAGQVRHRLRGGLSCGGGGRNGRRLLLGLVIELGERCRKLIGRDELGNSLELHAGRVVVSLNQVMIRQQELSRRRIGVAPPVGLECPQVDWCRCRRRGTGPPASSSSSRGRLSTRCTHRGGLVVPLECEQAQTAKFVHDGDVGRLLQDLVGQSRARADNRRP